MTREKAIKTLKTVHCEGCNDYGDCETCYIGTAIEALEKQIPKKPIQGTKYKWIDTVRERGRYRNVEKYSYRKACPICKKNVLTTNYCENCGQAIDWGEE